MIDVLFVHPGDADIIYQGLSTKFSAIETPTWCLLLAQSCRTKGFEVAILDCDAERLSYAESVKRIKEYDPRLVVFVVYGQNPNAGTTKMTGAIGLAKCLKEDSDYPICFAGSHTSALPKEVLALNSVDFILLNEGVYALHNLLATDLKDVRSIKGIGWKDNGVPTLNQPERVVPNDRMDIDLPGYAWDLLPFKNKPLDLYRSCNWHANFIESQRNPYAAMYTSLGCRFKCDFCLHEDTKLIVANGRNKKIKHITKSDKLLAFNTKNNIVVETCIKEIATRTVERVICLTLSDGKTIRTTEEHPFYVSGKWKNAGDIVVGDRCLVIDISDKRSFFAQHYNSMKKPGVALKCAKTKKMAGHVPFMATIEGRKVVAESAKKRASGPDNPMLKPSNREKASLRMRKEKNPCWQGGISTMFKEYPPEFSQYKRRQIKKRDNYTCQECEKTNVKLDVHHIDYNKFNNANCNLITLCASCHSKTNYDRNVWQEHYQEMMSSHSNCPHYVEVVNIAILEGNFTVYNVQCDPYDNYFAEYFLTHNCMINIVNRTDSSDGVTAANSPNMRFWSPEFIIQEFDKLMAMGVSTIRLSDEMFFLDKRYFEPLLSMLVERGYGKDLLMWAYARVDTVREKYLDLFNKAGVKWLALGIESADRKIRKEITKGTYEEVDIRDVVKDIQSAGISVIANYIFGLPDDTYETMQYTLDVALELNTEMANMYPCFALPGSPLYYQAKQRGWALPETFEAWSFHSYDSLPLPTNYLSAAEVMRFRDRAWDMYFKRPEYLSMVAEKFGQEASDHISEMASIKLKRKLLE